MPGVEQLRQALFKVEEEIKNHKCPAEASEDEVITTGDFRINITARKVRLLGDELELTSAEFDMLVFLINHPKKLVTQQTMLATSWSGNVVRQTKFLRVLQSLQNKLESRNPAHCYIRTEPWIVYQFDAATYLDKQT
jgi:two-component system KDP operon response regulator KdpE